MLSKLAPYALGALGIGAGGAYLMRGGAQLDPDALPGGQHLVPVPTRAQQVARLSSSTKEEPFDLLIIGGGATGTGCALDAATR